MNISRESLICCLLLSTILLYIQSQFHPSRYISLLFLKFIAQQLLLLFLCVSFVELHFKTTICQKFKSIKGMYILHIDDSCMYMYSVILLVRINACQLSLPPNIIRASNPQYKIFDMNFLLINWFVRNTNTYTDTFWLIRWNMSLYIQYSIINCMPGSWDMSYVPVLWLLYWMWRYANNTHMNDSH